MNLLQELCKMLRDSGGVGCYASEQATKSSENNFDYLLNHFPDFLDFININSHITYLIEHFSKP